MAIFLSPKVITQEQDATLTTQEKSNVNGGFVGTFKWGPVNEPTYISTGEKELVARFGTSDDTYYKSVLVAADLFSYTNTGWIVRMTGNAARNAFPASFTPQLIRNDSEFGGAYVPGVDFLGRYPGSYVNGLLVDIVDSAGFDSWEFKSAFTYRPKVDEYSVAVIDTTGNISGTGSVKQRERLLVKGGASGGVQQTQTLAISGSATGGIKQQESITFVGTATGTTITVNGTAVTLVVGDDQNTVATKVSDALALDTATYDSVSVIANIVTVTFKVPQSNQAAIVSGNQAGISWSSVIVTVGSAIYDMSVYGKTVTLAYGDSASTVTTKIYNAFGLDTVLFKNVSKPTATSIQYTYVEYGSKTLGVVTENGVTITPTISTPGSNAITITVFGVSVSILDKDSAETVASKIATTSGIIDLFNDVWVSGASVYYESKTTGLKTAQATPANQNSLTFNVSITTRGSIGTLVEKFELMSNDPKALFEDGTYKFWYDAINQGSRYIRAGDKTVALTDRSVTLVGGVDDNVVNVTSGYSLLNNKEQYNLSYLVAGDVSVEEQQAIIDVAESRLDCIAFVAPQMSDVVNNYGSEAVDVNHWRMQEIERSSTYAFAVDNWAYVYDKYSNVYRWIPATGGTAGVFARSAQENEPWTPPAGLNRGRYKNYIKLAWNPSEGERDLLYPNSINSIVSFPGTGIVLYGDKTMTNEPTAFGHVNTRMAFIVAKTSLADMARYFLFEINNEFTRAQFVNAARPFLRNMAKRNAFEDFRIIVDKSNNDAAVVTQNRMIVQVLIKPLYSINWIVLNLTAVRPDVSFDEFVQQ